MTTPHKTPRTNSPLKPGSVLIAVFWIMSILSLAVITTLTVVKMQSDTVTADSHGARARELAEKGIALAVHQNIKRSDPLLNYQAEGNTEGYRATYESMATTFGLNALINQMATNSRSTDGLSVLNSTLGLILTAEWGLTESDASLFLNCLAEWVDADDQVTTLEGWEEKNYEYEGLEGRPFNRYFKSLEEVTLVHGYEYLEAAKPNWRDYFNIWTGEKIDLSSASPEMISFGSVTANGRALSVEDAKLIYDAVIGEDGLRDTEDDLQTTSPEQLLRQYATGDVTPILDRYLFEGARAQYALIKSIGWSGQITLTVKMALQGRGSSPQLLERVESLEYSEYEQ